MEWHDAEWFREQVHSSILAEDFESAFEAAHAGVAMHPDHPDLLADLGFLRLHREEFLLAQGCLKRHLELVGGSRDIHLGLAEVAVHTGATRDAIHHLERALETEPVANAGALCLAAELYRRLGLYDEALKCSLRVIEVDPSEPKGYAGAGYAAHGCGDIVGAVHYLSRAVQLDPADVGATVYLGHLLFDLGRVDHALRAWESVPVTKHYDVLAIRRYLDLQRSRPWSSPIPLTAWREQLQRLEDPIEALLAEVGALAS